jgi:drug/metabolite transporter (DMT)-like permease
MPERKSSMRLPAMIAIIVGATIFSSSGLIVRHIEHATAWQIVFFRALSLIPAVCLAYVLRHRGRTVSELTRAGWRPLLAGPLQGISSVCFIMAITRTSVASTMLVLSAVPLFAAGLGWLFLRERVRFATFAAIGASTLGIALVMVDGFNTGTVVGNTFALVTSVLFACYIIVLRHNQHVDMLPTVVYGAVTCACVAGLVVPDFNVSTHDILLCVFWGAVVQGTGGFMTVFASKHLPAAELCMLSLLEFVLAPIWVWIFVGEVPGLYAVIGGAIVVLSVALWLIREQTAVAH